MKKALGGCLVVALLLLVVGGGALWWFVLRPAWQAGNELIGAATQFAQIAQIEMKIANRTPYTPPDDGRIPPDALARFIAVQQTLNTRAGDSLAVLEIKYKELEARNTSSSAEPDISDVLTAYGDLFGLVREAKVAQVDALNAQSMSIDEYRWLRSQAYLALGLANADDAPPPALQGTAVADNALLLQPHRALLESTAATAWLGF